MQKAHTIVLILDKSPTIAGIERSNAPQNLSGFYYSTHHCGFVVLPFFEDHIISNCDLNGFSRNWGHLVVLIQTHECGRMEENTFLPVMGDTEPKKTQWVINIDQHDGR